MKQAFSLFLTLGLVSALAQPSAIVPKQLAGPAEEMISGAMREVAPAEVGQRSRSAMMPIQLETTKTGALQWHGELPVEHPDNFKLVLFAPAETGMTLQLQAPFAKRAIDVEALAVEASDISIGIGTERFPARQFTFEGMAPGAWTVTATANAPARAKRTGGEDAFLLFGGGSDLQLYSHLTDRQLIVGRELGLNAYLYNKGPAKDGIVPKAAIGHVTGAHAIITAPNGENSRHPMFDDGLHNDGMAGDGIYGLAFTPEMPGDYTTRVVLKGRNQNDAPMMRTSNHLFPVAEGDVTIADTVAMVRPTDADRVAISIPTTQLTTERVKAFAMVWGEDAKGRELPIAWVGGISDIRDGSITMSLDTRWLAASGAVRATELRDLRIESVDNSFTLDRAPVVAMDAITLSKRTADRFKGVDEAMLMGVRPEMNSAKAGSKLLLVHGYCSGDAWGSAASRGDFSGYAIFQDFNQNRSHDAFARMVRDFGAAYSSFGVVAHSQGGAATLHLYTYYWSGLDNASGNRLIQSVGTPYQGTALAGNAASLGDIFGAGCGKNTDLTYDGASAWLSGIPSWARAKVHYATTSFNTRWWAYDYCNIATDLLLSDPEDGVIEKSKGQLSGGNNRGHKTGWCHTQSMRDPGQTTDRSRNLDMNGNAAR